MVLEVGGQEPGEGEDEVDSEQVEEAEEAEGGRFLTVLELLSKKSESIRIPQKL